MSSNNRPQWGQQRPGRDRPPRRNGWRPEDWSIKRGLMVGLSGFVVLLVLAAVFGGKSSKDRNTASGGPRPTVAVAVATSPPATSAAPTTPAVPTTTAAPSPTDTRPLLPDFSGTNLSRAQDLAQALGFHDLASHDLTGQGRHQVLDSDWHVCSQHPGGLKADPSTTTVTFDVVKSGESCSLRVHAAPSPAPTRTRTAAGAGSGGTGTSGGASGGSGTSGGSAAGASGSGGSSADTCAPHTVGTCAAGSPHPSGATAQCADGSYSYSAHFSGTCSHHGGVRYWYR